MSVRWPPRESGLRDGRSRGVEDCCHHPVTSHEVQEFMKDGGLREHRATVSVGVGGKISDVDYLICCSHDSPKRTLEIALRLGSPNRQDVIVGESLRSRAAVVICPFEGLPTSPCDPKDRELTQLRVDETLDEERVEPTHQEQA
jgi:hypothetical protein